MQPDNVTVSQPIRFEPLYGTAHIVITAFMLGFIIIGTIVGNMFVVAAILLDRNLQASLHKRNTGVADRLHPVD
ncbi:hypothetical protein CRM22_004777 [Opisthorchis felineus]|uniref:G-protein coupled receptors family 1 profile domain-containing protein n=1 Tax=Opisthorchis felineus TaxID=147828 RepID=A0A4S2LUH0_OPIFE|nr:hypothetical protein CRM22_004777 [Opisthorchis felineus]